MAECGGAAHFDVVVIGAGISGVGAGYFLQRNCARHTYVILERREIIGGTWDVFRYPGIRSDSDMYTLGYSFQPWTGGKAIADGADIREYVTSTARQYGIDKKIRFGVRVRRASWSTPACRWMLEAEGPGGAPVQYSCNFIYSCSGYYDHDGGYTPPLPGMARFRGRIVHPQKWGPADTAACEGKRVVVIGSGATAFTIVPALAKGDKDGRAAHVTMLQRTPTYVVSVPDEDPLARLLRALPTSVVYSIIRGKNVLLGALVFGLLKRYPDWGRRLILSGVEKLVGEELTREHFTPSYKPWDQRLCLVPNGDFFVSMEKKKVDVVTDHIDTLTESGIRLKSGRELPADVVVTATGLNIMQMGGVEVVVDGEPVRWGERCAYKGMMVSDVPNLAQAFGYTNASWTLKADLISEYVCRLLNHMRAGRYGMCCPRLRDRTVKLEPPIDFTSSYIKRGIHLMPQQGSKPPWRLYQNYPLDIMVLRWGSLHDGMEFTRPRPQGEGGAAPAPAPPPPLPRPPAAKL